MTVIGALSSFRELGEMSPHKRPWDVPTSAANSVLKTWTQADLTRLVFSEPSLKQ